MKNKPKSNPEIQNNPGDLCSEIRDILVDSGVELTDDLAEDVREAIRVRDDEIDELRVNLEIDVDDEW